VSTRVNQWAKIPRKNLPTALNTSDEEGLGDAPGAGGANAGAGGIVADPGGYGCALANIPPCSRHICVGSVPIRNGSETWRGHADVARPPDSGSIVAIVIPDGSVKSSGSAGAASCMN